MKRLLLGMLLAIGACDGGAGPGLRTDDAMMTVDGGSEGGAAETAGLPQCAGVISSFAPCPGDPHHHHTCNAEVSGRLMMVSDCAGVDYHGVAVWCSGEMGVTGSADQQCAMAVPAGY